MKFGLMRREYVFVNCKAKPVKDGLCKKHAKMISPTGRKDGLT